MQTVWDHSLCGQRRRDRRFENSEIRSLETRQKSDVCESRRLPQREGDTGPLSDGSSDWTRCRPSPNTSEVFDRISPCCKAVGKQASGTREEEKDFCDEATLLLKEFIQIIYQALIDFVPQLDDSGVLLERVEWILYCLMTKEFYDLVPRWQQELIDENHRMIELRV